MVLWNHCLSLVPKLVHVFNNNASFFDNTCDYSFHVLFFFQSHLAFFHFVVLLKHVELPWVLQVALLDLRFTMMLIILMKSLGSKHVLHLKLLWIKVMFDIICISMWAKLSFIIFWIYLVFFCEHIGSLTLNFLW